MYLIDLGESSLAGMTKLMSVGSVFVSTIATTGIPSFKASLTAACSLLASTTTIAAGGNFKFIIPPTFFSKRAISF